MMLPDGSTEILSFVANLIRDIANVLSAFEFLT